MSEVPTLKGAIINREWYDAAQEMLRSPEERCAFYEGVMRLAFGLECDDPESIAVRTMLRMVKPYVQADADKYAARCIRNRENAQQKRVAPSGTQSHPVAPSGSTSMPVGSNTNISTNNNTNTKTNNNTLSLKAEGETREKFDVCGILFRADARDILGECSAFWNYYASLGWKNSKGAPIVNKVAAARMWRIAGECAGEADWRDTWYQAFRSVEAPDFRLWTQVRGLRKLPPVSGEGDAQRLQIAVDGYPEFADWLDNHYLAQISAVCRASGCNQVEYVPTQQYIAAAR